MKSSEQQVTYSMNRDWWERLGLHVVSDPGASEHERRTQEAVIDVLRQYSPVEFVVGDADSAQDRVSVDDVVEKMEAQKQDCEEERRQRYRKASAHAWERIRAAYASPDADAVIGTGRWEDFTRADALSWCWNLFQYEPQGFAMPGLQLRVRAMRELEAGGIPSVFGYPERARELKERGLTPQQYREHQEKLGKVPFAREDVRHR